MLLFNAANAGPSKCPSVAVMQPQGGGKTLKKRPAWKAFIRNRMPECCPVRAVFAWLSCQFLHNSEPMPMPGDDSFLLFPGTKPGEPMSISNHARIVLKVFEMLDIEPPKVTHEFRVFAAQALHDMGVALEVSPCGQHCCFCQSWMMGLGHKRRGGGLTSLQEYVREGGGRSWWLVGHSREMLS